MSGRKWAYFGVILGFAASITANIASTVLKETEVSLLLRVPFAIFWPLATYVAIEVLARTDWAGSLSHRLLRAVLAVPVGAVAAFVSYLHQHHLMQLAGEPGLAQGFGPLAVDCLLFACAAVLILTRPKGRSASEISVEEMLRKWEIQEESAPEEIPVSAPPRTPRAPRASWSVEQVVDMILRGEKQGDIVTETKIGRSTLGRYVSVVKELKANRSAAIAPERKVPAAHVQVIREMVSR